MALAGAQPLLQKFEARSKVARKSPFDRNVEKVLVFLRNPQERAGWNFDNFFFEKPLVFLSFYVKIVTNTEVLEGFRLARTNVHFTLFFARDS